METSNDKRVPFVMLVPLKLGFMTILCKTEPRGVIRSCCCCCWLSTDFLNGKSFAALKSDRIEKKFSMLSAVTFQCNRCKSKLQNSVVSVF